MEHDLSRRAFLKRGLAAAPQTISPAPAGPRRRVLVVGAGLAAAHELLQAGPEVTVLEARGRGC
jgi:NADPH-dependent 2,4-dienoyl-CoA reductase/sulfur reductase-like enzyme